MDIVVFGAGSLGSLLGGILARNHTVTVVARDPHASAIHDAGLQVTGEFECVTHPTVTIDGHELEGELALITVKSFDTETAAEALATGSFEAVCSLQNGMGNEETLAAHVDCPVLAGTASYGALYRKPGVVACTGHGKIVLGPRTSGQSPIADRAAAAFRSAGLDAIAADDMPRRLWKKLAVNAGINAITALTRTQNGAVLDGETTAIARAASRETARTARSAGVSLSNQEAIDAMKTVASRTAANTSSMAQDIRADRRTEIDAINGYVVDRAADQGVAVPINRTLTALVRTWERERGLRE